MFSTILGIYLFYVYLIEFRSRKLLLRINTHIELHHIGKFLVAKYNLTEFLA